MSLDIDLKNVIRSIPDWPTQGITFRDITPIFKDPAVFHDVVDTLCNRYLNRDITHIACIDARGFLAASVMAYKLNLPLVLIRKQGKLPGECISQAYTLEYGSTCLEIQIDACKAGDRVLLFDDLIATGGTLIAAITLIHKLSAQVVEVAALVDLPDLGGSRRVAESDIACFSMCAY